MGRGMSVQLRPFRKTAVHGRQIFSMSHHSCSPLQPVTLGCVVTGSIAGRTFRHGPFWRSVQVGAEPQRTGSKWMGCRDGTTAWRERTRSPLCDFHKNASDQECGIQSCRSRVSKGRGRIHSGKCPQPSRNTSQCLWAERVDLAASVNRTTCPRKLLHRPHPQEAHLLAATRRYSNSTAYRGYVCSEHDRGGLR